MRDLLFLQPKSNRRNPLQPVEVTVNSNRRIPLQPTKKQGGLTMHKVRLNAAQVSMIGKGDCLQDVHITLANALLKQFPDRAGFQLTLYVANGRCIPQKEAKYTLMK